MPRVVHGDDRAHHLEQLRRHVVEGEPLGAGERPGVAGHGPHLVVRRHRPEAGAPVLGEELDTAAARTDRREVSQPGGDVVVPERSEDGRIHHTQTLTYLLVRCNARPCSTDTHVSGSLRLVFTYQSDDAWAALADGTRRAIFKRLADGPMAVGELARELPVSRPAVSQHLKVLSCAGLVRHRAAGTRRLYQVDPKGIETLRSELDAFWDKALTAFAALADEEGDPS
jgi:DNA-binding transcriptional ArsR family regulator